MYLFKALQVKYILYAKTAALVKRPALSMRKGDTDSTP